MDKDQHVIVWEGTAGTSIECLTWQMQDEGISIASHLVGVADEVPFAIHYLIETDKTWLAEHILVSDLNNANNTIELYSDKKGKWFHRDEAVSSLEGCLDVDLSLTPFSNTLPIRRLQWEVEKRICLEVVYIKLPGFRIERMQQYYTRLSPLRFLYENVTTDFKAEMTVDDNGMIIEYPGIAKRIFPAN